MACWNTLLASSMSALSWMLVERVATREGTALGMISGAVVN
jgi:ammonia channel protein AmtB